MTSSNGNSRLDRIEEILAQTAIQTAANAQAIAATEQIANSNARAIEANTSGLAETKALVNANALAITATEQIANSNARAIEGNSAALTEVRRVLADQGERIEQANAIAVNAVISMVDSFDHLSSRIDFALERFDAQAEQVREIATEVRGLQTENRRILDVLQRLEGEQG